MTLDRILFRHGSAAHRTFGDSVTCQLQSDPRFTGDGMVQFTTEAGFTGFVYLSDVSLVVMHRAVIYRAGGVNPPIINVGDLIAALSAFPPGTPVGCDDYLSGDALYLGELRLDENGILRVGTGGRYSGRIPTGDDDEPGEEEEE